MNGENTIENTLRAVKLTTAFDFIGALGTKLKTTSQHAKEKRWRQRSSN